MKELDIYVVWRGVKVNIHHCADLGQSNQNESTTVKTDQVIDRSVRRDDLLKLSGIVHREKVPYFK